MSQNCLLVVADDLTGANDTGVMFAEKGYSTILKINRQLLNQTDFSQADVFTVSTDTRASRENAAEITFSAIQAASGISQLYLKIDSTMRGSVQYQIDGALKAWKTRYPNAKAIICSAYPEMGRTIEKGILYVNGIPVTDTPSGKDVICPVTSSIMTDLLPNAEQVSFSTEQELLQKVQSSNLEQIVVDAKTGNDLEIIARVIERLGKSVIPVGSAGLANKLKLQTLPSSNNKRALTHGRSLILVTSIHETSQNQVDEYIAHNGGDSIVFNPSPLQLLNHKISAKALREQLKALITFSESDVIIRANPTKVVSAENDINMIARTLAKDLAELSLYCLNHKHFDHLILFGGDGAATLLEQMNVTEMKLLYSIVPGVPVCQIQNSQYENLTVMTKSGGFGNNHLLSDIMKLN